MGNSCEQLVHSRYTQLGLQPTVGHWSLGQGPSGRSPAVETYEGWMTSYGVCGHLLDSLSAWGHSVTLWKPEQARFGQFYGIMFFWKASPQTEGRRHAHPLIKTSPGGYATAVCTVRKRMRADVKTRDRVITLIHVLLCDDCECDVLVWPYKQLKRVQSE